MKLASSRRQLVLGVVALILLLFAATQIIDTKCSLAVASLDEPTWEELQQLDFEPGRALRNAPKD